MADPGTNSVAEFATRTGTLIATRRYGFDEPAALAVSHGRLWVVNAGNGTVSVLNARTGALISHGVAGKLGRASAVCAVAGRNRLWVGYGPADSVAEYSTVTGKLLAVLHGPAYHLNWPSAMALAGGSLWIASARGDSLTSIDTTTGLPLRVLRGPAYRLAGPAGIASYRDRLWVTNLAGDSVTELRVPKARRGAAGSAAPPSRPAQGARR